MADLCCFPFVFGIACCMLGKCHSASKDVNRKGNRVHNYDDELPRKMTPYEYQIYCAHMNTYGRIKSN